MRDFKLFLAFGLLFSSITSYATETVQLSRGQSIFLDTDNGLVQVSCDGQQGGGRPEPIPRPERPNPDAPLCRIIKCSNPADYTCLMSDSYSSSQALFASASFQEVFDTAQRAVSAGQCRFPQGTCQLIPCSSPSGFHCLMIPEISRSYAVAVSQDLEEIQRIIAKFRRIGQCR